MSVPRGAWDSHGHILGPLERFPLADGGDAHDAPFEAYVRKLDALGIDRGVVAQTNRYGTDNRALLDALERSAGRLRGIIRIRPEELDEKSIARLDALGVRGVRIQEDLGALEPLAERFTGTGWRIEVVPPDAATIVAMRPQIEKLACPVLIDQMGHPDTEKGLDDPSFRGLLAMLRDGVVWIKLHHPHAFSRTGPPYADVLPFAQALAAANPARCVWGADWPRTHGKPEAPQESFLLGLFHDWVPDAAVRRRILVDNPATLNA